MISKRAVKRFLLTVLRSCRIYPNVWSVGNAFKVHEFRELVDPSGLRPGDVVLDLGCGQGLQTELLAARGAQVTGIDVSAEAIGKALERKHASAWWQRLSFVCSPLEDARLPESSFDHVFSFCVLEHIQNLDAVLAELFRVVKPGGRLHLTVDSLGNIDDQALIAKHRVDHFVVEYFSSASIRARLTDAGFDVTESYPIFTSPLARVEFSRRIATGGSLNLFGKIRLYRHLRREDQRDGTEKGIMVLVRARKPVASVSFIEIAGARDNSSVPV